MPLLLWSACVQCQASDTRAAPEALRQLHLVDQDGALVDEHALSERIVVLNFMFTRCPSACPKLTQLLRETFHLLPSEARRQVQFLSISVDPAHDQPATLKDFARKHRADLAAWRFARLDERDLSLLSERLAVFEPGSRAEPSAHSMAIYLFDRRGRPRQRYNGTSIEPKRLAREITTLATLEQP